MLALINAAPTRGIILTLFWLQFCCAKWCRTSCSGDRARDKAVRLRLRHVQRHSALLRTPKCSSRRSDPATASRASTLLPAGICPKARRSACRASGSIQCPMAHAATTTASTSSRSGRQRIGDAWDGHFSHDVIPSFDFTRVAILLCNVRFGSGSWRVAPTWRTAESGEWPCCSNRAGISE